jgi:hypothetical protein
LLNGAFEPELLTPSQRVFGSLFRLHENHIVPMPGKDIPAPAAGVPGASLDQPEELSHGWR